MSEIDMANLRYVSLLKIGAVESPARPPGNPDTYAYGRLCLTGHSLPAGYLLEGWLMAPPVMGEIVRILRCANKEGAGHGCYFSSAVTWVGDHLFHTENSVYRLIELVDLGKEKRAFAMRHPGLSELAMAPAQRSNTDSDVAPASDPLEEALKFGFINLLGQEGGSANAKDAAKLYGGANDASEEAVREAARNGQVIAIRGSNNNLHFPIWQFGPGGGTIPGLAEVLAALAPRTIHDDLAPLTFFLNKTARLGGLSPLEALRIGGEERVKAVKRLAIESTE